MNICRDYVAIPFVMLLLPGLAHAQAMQSAQAKHTPTIDESLSLKSVGSPMISPDGRFVAYRMNETNWKDNEFISQIWLVNIATGASFQLTRGKHGPGAAEWSPDGKWLAFVAERESSAIEPLTEEKKEEKKEKDAKKEDGKDADAGGGKPATHQIWLISPEGGEAWQLTKSSTDVGDFEWSKDSKSIAFAANPVETKASKDRKEKYSDYDVFEKDYQQNQLWLVDVVAALTSFLPVEAKQLTSDLSLNVGSFAWSPDSTRIAFSATRNPLLAFGGDEDIYLLDLTKNNAVKKIVALPGPDGSPMFSPDGKQLEVYAKTSPITTIKQAKTPTLIQQGSNDKRVPVPDSYELYRGLQDEGVASRLIFYTGFGHGVNKPKSRRALLQSNLDWFNHYIWGEAFPKDSPLFGTSEASESKSESQ
jgi:dipeptidyl aminopeptidase/acylaminoacyl peptidase